MYFISNSSYEFDGEMVTLFYSLQNNVGCLACRLNYFNVHQLPSGRPTDMPSRNVCVYLSLRACKL